MEPIVDTRVIVHFDVDSFYVACELLRYPHLNGKPVVVTQNNSGGFVALSKAAKDAGLRKGDGIGQHGHEALSFYQDRPEATIEFVRRKCPNLVILPMETEYYRSCSDKVFMALNSFDSTNCIVEQHSMDDFFVDITQSVNRTSSLKNFDLQAQTYLANSHESYTTEEIDKRYGRRLAVATAITHSLRQQVSKALGSSSFSLSGGIANCKLLARLISKRKSTPNTQTLLLPNKEQVEILLAKTPLRSIPNLKGKLGEELVKRLKAHTLIDLRSQDQSTIKTVISDCVGGEGKGVVAKLKWLMNASWGIDRSEVKARELPKSITSAKSFAPCRMTSTIFMKICREICHNHVKRLEAEKRLRRRIPKKVAVLWRIGYGEGTTSTRHVEALPEEMTCEWLVASLIKTIRAQTHPSAKITRVNVISSEFMDIPKQTLHSFFEFKPIKRKLNEDVSFQHKSKSTPRKPKKKATIHEFFKAK